MASAVLCLRVGHEFPTVSKIRERKMKKLVTTVFAVLMALTLSAPAWSQPSSQDNSKKSDSNKDSDKKGKKGNPKGGKKKGDDSKKSSDTPKKQ
jgi:hypothetical protein